MSLREQLAELAHEQWSGWMRYLFEKSAKNADGTVTIPAWAAQRWGRQAETAYADLPESEKKSDREEADRVLAILEERDDRKDTGYHSVDQVEDLGGERD